MPRSTHQRRNSVTFGLLILQSEEDPYEWPSEEARLAAQRRAQRHTARSDSKPDNSDEPLAGQIVTRVDQEDAARPAADATPNPGNTAQDRHGQ